MGIINGIVISFFVFAGGLQCGLRGLGAGGHGPQLRAGCREHAARGQTDRHLPLHDQRQHRRDQRPHTHDRIQSGRSRRGIRRL